MEGWIGLIVEGGSGERMNVSTGEGIRWPPGLTAAPLRTTTGVLTCLCVCVCVFTLAETSFSRLFLFHSKVHHYLSKPSELVMKKLIFLSVFPSNTL